MEQFSGEGCSNERPMTLNGVWGAFVFHPGFGSIPASLRKRLSLVVMQFAHTKPVKSASSSREIFHSTLAFLDEFHGHVAQLGINPAPSQQGPPFVKIDLHRSPHGDPSGNREALPHDGSPSARLMP